MNYKPETFTGVLTTNIPSEFLCRLDRQFNAISKSLNYTKPVVRTFVSASAGAVTELLPPGAKSQYDYFFLKTDASANAVTIQTDGTETINGSTTYVLAAQYDRVHVVWNSDQWYVLSA